MTPERFARIREALCRRQPDLTVLMERVHKSHNFSAILRTCDAVGVLDAHVVLTDRPLEIHHGTSAGSAKWIRVHRHETVEAAVLRLRADGFRILALHPDPDAADYRQVDFTSPTALMVGAELHGISAAGIELSDGRVVIPMAGMVRSLNVSVAAAVVLFEAMRQRRTAGLYDASRLPAETFRGRLFEWAHPRVARRCRERDVPYPPLGPDGDILAAGLPSWCRSESSSDS